MDSIHIDAAVLENKTEIDMLNEGLQQYTGRKTEEIPEAENRLQERRIEISERLQTLAPGLSPDEIDQLRIPFTDEELALKLAEEIKDARINVEQFEKRYEEIFNEKTDIERNLADTGEPKDVSGLKRLLSEIREKGDMEERWEKWKEELDEKERNLRLALKSQSVWKGTLEQLESIRIPGLETIERYQQEWLQWEKAIHEVKSNLDKIQEERIDTENRLKELELTGHVPAEEELLEVRAKRDRNWHLIKKVWLEKQKLPEDYASERDLSAAFEKTMAEADDISDQMRKQSERLATRDQLLLKKDHLLAKIAHIENSLQEKQATFEQLQASWEKEWAPCRITPKTPSEMKDWIANFYRPALERLADRKKLRDELEKLANQINEYMEKLRDELAGVEIDTALSGLKLKKLLSDCEQVIEEEEKRKRTFLYENL